VAWDVDEGHQVQALVLASPAGVDSAAVTLHTPARIEVRRAMPGTAQTVSSTTARCRSAWQKNVSAMKRSAW